MIDRSPTMEEADQKAVTVPRWRIAVRQAVILAVMMFASLGCYLAVENWRGPGTTIVTQTEWDRAIPFNHYWVWVYLFPYLIGPILVGLLRPATFAWFIRCGLTTVIVSLLIFIALPTKTVRPDASGIGAGFTADIYRNMTQTDYYGGNAAPSLHVSLTCLLALALFCDFPRWRLPTILGIGIVWLSTLLTHQHHLIDVATGILLALVVGAVFRKRLASGAA
jgi:membrane-associated phospholipid phosphatase